MTRSLRLLLAALAVVASLAIGTGLALATGGHHASPAATVAVSSHGDDGAEHGTGDQNEQEPADTGDDSSGDSRPATGTGDNHGAAVSKVARETPPGPDHGKIVSAVARDNHGAAAGGAREPVRRPPAPLLRQCRQREHAPKRRHVRSSGGVDGGELRDRE